MPKLIDAFLFLNELDLLEIRLNELNSVVDHFVIVESLAMHGSAKTRDACLANNWDVARPFEKKIKYVLLDELEPSYTNALSGWMRENFHRNALMAPVMELARPEDVVMVSDCDEIPRASALRRVSGIHFLNLDFFYYSVNRYVGPWARSTIGTLADYQRAGGFQAPRGRLDMPPTVNYPTIENAGWHFSYFGSLAGIRSKVERVLQHGTSTFCREFLERDDRQAAADIAAGRDLYRTRGMPPFQYRATGDRRLPVHFLNNQKKYEHFTEDFFKKQNRELL
jgi:beta-1,4-mannosyl-glycoprotein beta-1,4-N-acetylglucosaminyltransferase